MAVNPTRPKVFVKALYELFKDDLGLDGGDRATALELANFQQEGFRQVVKLIEKHNAVMVADSDPNSSRGSGDRTQIT